MLVLDQPLTWELGKHFASPSPSLLLLITGGSDWVILGPSTPAAVILRVSDTYFEENTRQITARLCLVVSAS